MIEFTIFDAAGAVIEVVSRNTPLKPALMDPGTWAIAGAWPADRYRIDLSGEAPVPVELAAMDLTVSANTISGIPAGAWAYFKGVKHRVDDGTLEFAAEMGLPEQVAVTLRHPLWLEATVTVSCA